MSQKTFAMLLLFAVLSTCATLARIHSRHLKAQECAGGSSDHVALAKCMGK